MSLVETEAVDSIRESQRLRSASGRLFRRESKAALVASGRPFRRDLAAALVASGRLFGRESTAALKWSALWKRGVTATWVRGVVNPLEESRQRFLSTNPTGVDTLRPSSMLNDS